MGVKRSLLTLREEHGLRVSENMVLRRASGPRRGEMIEGWIKLHNKEPHVYFLPCIITSIKPKRTGWEWYEARIHDFGG
jgi:hypothetical protein